MICFLAEGKSGQGTVTEVNPKNSESDGLGVSAPRVWYESTHARHLYRDNIKVCLGGEVARAVRGETQMRGVRGAALPGNAYIAIYSYIYIYIYIYFLFTGVTAVTVMVGGDPK